ncbi:MAG: hypothetical protein HOY76_05040 [Streptomyces sp.]|nr:hypothetical protein [Streptomyces sp.]NUS11826.1 hypothetical protein [Streptomyces sp.]
MFSQKKLATASLILGGLSMAGIGMSHAYAAGPSNGCSRDAQGNVTCVHKTEKTFTTSDGTVHVQQAQECSSASREVVDTPQTVVGQVGQLGTTRIGPVVNCSEHAPAPQGFQAPVVPR